MSRQGETGCMYLIVIGGFLILFNFLRENPIFIVYIILGICGVLLLIFLFNYLHTLYLIKFSSKIKTILKYNVDEPREHFHKLLKLNRTEKFDIDEDYIHFISISKIFQSK